MTYDLLLVAHIAVLGYWLGADLCINSTFRRVATAPELGFATRDAMFVQLMHNDQHVRYALVLELALGTMLSALLGYVPALLFWIAPVLAVAWLALIELTHRRRNSSAGPALARIDRVVRYAMLVLLLAAALGLGMDAPGWLRAKLALFALIIACGVAIRLFVIRFGKVWSELRAQGDSDARQAEVLAVYRGATGVLILLWASIAAITLLAVFKPG